MFDHSRPSESNNTAENKTGTAKRKIIGKKYEKLQLNFYHYIIFSFVFQEEKKKNLLFLFL